VVKVGNYPLNFMKHILCCFMKTLKLGTRFIFFKLTCWSSGVWPELIATTFVPFYLLWASLKMNYLVTSKKERREYYFLSWAEFRESKQCQTGPKIGVTLNPGKKLIFDGQEKPLKIIAYFGLPGKIFFLFLVVIKPQK
jgi:hypothetical protein